MPGFIKNSGSLSSYRRRYGLEDQLACLLLEYSHPTLHGVSKLLELARQRLNPALTRWIFLILIALVELTWLAIRIEVPATGFLSYFKGSPSIFVTSLVIVTILGWALSRGKLLELPIFQDFSHNPWPMAPAHVASFAAFFWLTIFVTEGNAVSSPSAIFWVLAWAATGLAAGAFWMLAAMPARAWICLIRQNSSFVLVGIIIIAASWMLGFFTNRAWEPLIGPTFLIVKWLLLAFGQEVVSQPAELLLGTSQFAVEIYPACAGYEGIGLISVFAGGYLWLFRRGLRFPNAFILLPCGILIIWLVNEEPEHADVSLATHKLTIDESIKRIMEDLSKRGIFLASGDSAGVERQIQP